MWNAYQRAMLFLTYIQGPVVNEWVKGVKRMAQRSNYQPMMGTHG
jgi:hypothetical protein